MQSRRLAILYLLVLIFSVPAAFACGFQYDPVSTPHYYREQGWSLPGTTAFNSLTVHRHNLSSTESIGGALGRSLVSESPNVVNFPAQEFLFNGVRQRMRAAQVQVGIVQWVMQGRIIAYSYSLTPVVAHREKGRWTIDAMATCVYFATFIDDRGDGVFRVLVPNGFTAELVPSWVRTHKN